jgi:hypothetical protein
VLIFIERLKNHLAPAMHVHLRVLCTLMMFHIICTHTCSSDAYAVAFLQYWVFVIGTPVVMALAVLYAITDNVALGVIVS